MRLLSLKLEKFRSYENLSIDFDENSPVTLLLGENAQGKTNILEAIALLAFPKSFRGVPYHNLIKHDEDFFRIEAKVSSSKVCQELAVSFVKKPEPRKILKSGGKKLSDREFIGTLRAVIFSPEDGKLISGGPEYGRQFLNMVNAQVDSGYFHALLQYHKALKARNALLKAIREGKSQPAELYFWDNVLAKEGMYLTVRRRENIDFLNEKLGEQYRSLSESAHEILLSYRSQLSVEEKSEQYCEHLTRGLSYDLQTLSTNFGPHRDSLRFFLNGKNMKEFASRGEIRTALLALKFAELQYREQKIHQKPLLLLDDVFSELDSLRQGKLMEKIEGYQTIITATRCDMPERQHRGIQSFYVKDGLIHDIKER
ncbi:DNA replication/repair protein RecF [Candidatus Peregrinibacteria bacterium]|nr:DNA replication/repair protein RecF [Candidatus Peregrinibacteria bacterium]